MRLLDNCDRIGEQQPNHDAALAQAAGHAGPWLERIEARTPNERG
jgi:hypothetical protein